MLESLLDFRTGGHICAATKSAFSVFPYISSVRSSDFLSLILIIFPKIIRNILIQKR